MLRLAVAVVAAVGLAAGVTGTASAAPTPPSGLTAVFNEFRTDPTPCLDVRGGSHSAGAFVQIFDCNGTPAQQWRFLQTRFGTYEILNADDLCLSPDPKTGPVAMGLIRQEPCGPPGSGQQWTLAGADDPHATFTLVNAESADQFVLSVRRGGDTDEITLLPRAVVDGNHAGWHF